MDASLKELGKLEKITATNGKTPTIISTLDLLLESLQQAKAQLEAGTGSKDTLQQVASAIDSAKKSLDDKHKEIYAATARIGKTLDKKFTATLPTYSPLFSSPESVKALEQTVALHFLRTGQFEIADTFMEESRVEVDPAQRAHFVDLHRILQSLRSQDVEPALQWASHNRFFLQSRASPLIFHLHRSQYIRLLLSTHPPNPLSAISYAKANLQPFYAEYAEAMRHLMTCIAYLPLTKLQTSPYAYLASPSLHFDLEPLFAREYCTSLKISRQVPLRVVADIGGGGALNRIEKGRKVMRERKSEVWSQTDELPIEIPLPAENQYHSVFACPVSKEQSTEQNPPMMMLCGHVLNKDSLQRLSKPGARVKCPYCPNESPSSSAVRLYL